jgi:hypothetical protein
LFSEDITRSSIQNELKKTKLRGRTIKAEKVATFIAQNEQESSEVAYSNTVAY